MRTQVGCKKGQKYGMNLLEEADSMVRSKAIRLSHAPQEYGLSKSTLHDKVTNRYVSCRKGPKTFLSAIEENR